LSFAAPQLGAVASWASKRLDTNDTKILGFP
jgi:hypothetical protein